MESQKLSAIYALALYEMGGEQKMLPAITEDIGALQKLWKANPYMDELLESPKLNRKQKTEFIDKILKGKIESMTLGFLKVLVNNRRQNQIGEIFRVFGEIAANQWNKVSVKLTTAEKLADAQLTEFRAKLRNQIGGDFLLTTEIDPEIIGGYVVRVNDLQVDASLRTHVRKIKNSILGMKFRSVEFVSEA